MLLPFFISPCLHFLFNIILQLRPNFADAWSNLASAYMRKGRLSEATQCCQQALSLNPLLVIDFMILLFKFSVSLLLGDSLSIFFC